MNKNIFEGEWEETKGKMKKFWEKLTDEDFKFIEENHQEIYGALQKYYGYSMGRAEQAINDFKSKR